MADIREPRDVAIRKSKRRPELGGVLI